jgi:hypothetical protein
MDGDALALWTPQAARSTPFRRCRLAGGARNNYPFCVAAAANHGRRRLFTMGDRAANDDVQDALRLRYLT